MHDLKHRLGFVDSPSLSKNNPETISGVDVGTILLERLLEQRVSPFVVLLLALEHLGIVSLEHTLFDSAVIRRVRRAYHRILVVRQCFFLRIRRGVGFGQVAQRGELLLRLTPSLCLEQNPTSEGEGIGTITFRRNGFIRAFERRVVIAPFGPNFRLTQDGINVIRLRGEDGVVSCLRRGVVSLLFL